MSEQTNSDRVSVELSFPAAVFLRATVEHMNQRKMLPEGDAQALQTSAWLEEIEAKLTRALNRSYDDVRKAIG